jgi:LysM repeat protein
MKSFVEKALQVMVLMVLILPVVICGCVTTDRSSQASNIDEEDYLYLKEQVDLLKNKVEAIEANQAQLLQEIRRSKETDGSSAALKLRTDELERKLASIDAARIKEHQALVEQINAKLSTMANILQQHPSATGSSPKTGAAPRSSSTKTASITTTKADQSESGKEEQVGYEHTVQPGETLSAIASAYKVSVKAIMEANNIAKPENLKAGQKLFIPK